jgi:alkyl hydroperoxide reductase subunit AhpF
LTRGSRLGGLLEHLEQPSTRWETITGTAGAAVHREPWNKAEIVIDAKGPTSLPGVFMAGEATTAPHEQIVIAAGESLKAAPPAFDRLIRMPGMA